MASVHLLLVGRRGPHGKKEARMNHTARSVSYMFLCTIPFLGIGAAAARPLRIQGVYQAGGAILFALIAIAAWILGARVIGSELTQRRRLAVAGTLLVVPWAMISLLWIGIGAPFQATPTENHMRFLLLLANSIFVTGAFVVLKEELSDAGERFYSTLGFAACIPAGTAYLGCMSLISAAYVARLRDSQAPPMGLLSDVFDVLEFTACVLTYLATAAYAAALGQARLLGRGATRGYVIASSVLLLLLAMRGLSYPDLTPSSAPWYMNATFFAGIPAIPWIMPCLLGVVLLSARAMSYRSCDLTTRCRRHPRTGAPERGR